MRTFEITPLKQAGCISFGMPRTQVRELLGKFKEFKKNKFSKTTTDAFSDCHVYYDEDDLCDAVEFFAEATVQIGPVNVFGTPYDVLRTVIRSADADMQEDESGFTSKKLGFCAYAPDGKLESVLACSDKYLH